MKISKHVLYPGLGLALSLPLMFAPNTLAKLIGLVGTAGGGGYLASQVAMVDETKKRRESFRATEKRLAAREQSLSTRNRDEIGQIEAQLHVAEDARDAAIERVREQHRQFEAERERLIDGAKQVMGEELTRRFEREYAEKLAQATADMNRREDEFYHAEGDLCDQIEALQAVLSQNEDYLREEFGKETGARVQQWAGRYKQLQGQIAQYGQVIEAAAGEATEELQQKDLIIAKLRGQVELLNAPKKYRGRSQDDITANKVLEFFLSRGVAVEAEDWTRRYHQLKVLLFPKGGKLAELQVLADDLQVELGLYARPTIQVEGSCFAIQCDTDAKVAVKATIKEPPLSKLEQAISDAIHVRIAAPSGSGKSVLLGNLVNYLTETYLSSYDLYDPKVTAREVWGNLTPTHYSTDCLPALFALAEQCLKRINLCKVAAEKETAPPQFNPEFHIIDELEFCYGLVDIADDKRYTPKKFATNVKAGLKVGREHKIKLLFVTQSALCSDVNLKKNDFFNVTSLFLGQTIIEALDSDLMTAVSAEKKAVLRAEYKARLARGDKYTMLVYEPEKPTEAWLCSAPSPGYYAALSTAQSPKSDQNENPDLRGVAPRNQSAVAIGETKAGQSVQAATGSSPATDSGCTGTSGAPVAPVASTALESLLAQGTHCPNCGTHTKSYSKRKPNKSGNVSLKCLNKKCCEGTGKKTFSWKVI